MKKLVVILGAVLFIISGCSSDTTPDGTKLTVIKHKKCSKLATNNCKHKTQTQVANLDS